MTLDKPTFHGVASAMMNSASDDGHVLMVTTLSGSEKGQIFIEDELSQGVDIRDPKSVFRAYEKFFNLIALAARRQAGQQFDRKRLMPGSIPPVPVIQGWSSKFESEHAPTLVASLRSSYNYVLEDMPNPTTTQGRLEMINELSMARLEDDSVYPRKYIEPTGRLVKVVGDFGSFERKNEEVENALAELRTRIEAGDIRAQGQLLAMTGVLASQYAQIQRQSGANSRFFLLAPQMEPFLSQRLVPNFVGWNPLLRQFFASVLIDELGLKSNISVKVPSDPQSLPFADPLAARIADTMDTYHKGWPDPVCVLAKRRGVNL